MSDTRLHSLLRRYQRRLRIADASLGLLMAAAVSGAVLGGALLLFGSSGNVRIVAASALGILAAAVFLRSWTRWTLSRVALAVDTRARLDNLVVTATDVASGRNHIRNGEIRDELFATATMRLAQTDAVSVQPLRRTVGTAVLAVSGLVTLLVFLPVHEPLRVASANSAAQAEHTLASGDVRVVVRPPAYAQRPSSEAMNPASVSALEGSELSLHVGTSSSSITEVRLLAADGTHTPFDQDNGRATLVLRATEARPLLIRQFARDGRTVDRLVQLRVERDERAVVAIRQPARDLIFAEGRGQIPVEIAASDDVGLRSLVLRYTRVSGSGETFSFEEGEWPIEIARESATAWRGRGVLSLEKLNLQDGDSIVYRAVARDAKPDGEPAASESYLIEIGRLAGLASQGFAIPEERDRHAISQQMVIAKTETLHAARGTMTAADVLEQSQMLAVEQRMVQSEFVFMTGGHVHDEIEEAEASHEIAEGRLENAATVEMLNAIREMSRAEARLNAGDTAGALTFERAALAALQKAFDRRRYFLRTLPERARIDTSRRLSGELEGARSSAAAVTGASRDPLIDEARTVPAQLEDARTVPAALPLLASRLLALDSTSEALQDAALKLTSAHDEETRGAAIRTGERAVIEFLYMRTPRHLSLPLERSPLKGRLLQELPGGGRLQ